jgi:hypothetical protein
MIMHSVCMLPTAHRIGCRRQAEGYKALGSGSETVRKSVGSLGEGTLTDFFSFQDIRPIHQDIRPIHNRIPDSQVMKKISQNFRNLGQLPTVGVLMYDSGRPTI